MQEKVITVPKKPLLLVFPYLELLSLQNRTKLRKSLKGIHSCYRLQIVFGSHNILANAFRFKDCIPKELISGVVYKFQNGLCSEYYYGGSVRDFNVRIGETIGISSLTKKNVKPKVSAVSDHLLFCNHSPSFSVLTKKNRKFVSELSLLINRDTPHLL